MNDSDNQELFFIVRSFDLMKLSYFYILILNGLRNICPQSTNAVKIVLGLSFVNLYPFFIYTLSLNEYLKFVSQMFFTINYVHTYVPMKTHIGGFN